MDRSGEARLRDVVAAADKVVVVAGTSYDPKRPKANPVLASIGGRRAVDELIEALACENTELAPTEPGGPSLVFLEGRSATATITLVDTDLVRCPALWVGDARLVDPSELHALLDDHGVAADA